MAAEDEGGSVRLTAAHVRVTSLAALLGLGLGVALSYVPYLFGGLAFRTLFVQSRLLGLLLLAGGGLVVAASMPPWRSRVARTCGRVLLLVGYGLFVVHLTRISLGWTGPVVYSLLMLCVAGEALPCFSRRGLLPEFTAALAWVLGGVLLLGRVSATLQSTLGGLLVPIGAVLLVAGVALVLTRGQPSRWGARAAFASLVPALGLLAYGFGVRHVWSGALCYGLLALTCVLVTWAPRVSTVPSFQRRLLGATCVAAFVPLLALGGVATVIAERAIHRQLHLRLQEAARARAEVLQAHLSTSGAPPAVSGQALARQATLGSPRQVVQVLERRSGALLADSSQGRFEPGVTLLAQVLRADAASGPVLESFDGRARPVLAAYADIGQTGWRVVVVEDVSSANTPVTRVGEAAIVLLLLAGGGALLLANALGRALSRGLLEIRDATTQIAAGRLDARVEAQELSELADVAEAFNLMVGQTQGAQQALHATNEELRSALAVRDEFLSMAGHELRTPLTSAGLAVASLLRRLDSPQAAARVDAAAVRTSLQRVGRQLQRLTRLTSDLLDVAKIRAGRLHMAPVETELVGLVGEVVEHFAQGTAAAARIVFESAAEPLFAEVDPVRIEQVVLNLVENSVKYSPAGGMTRVRVAPEPGGVRITVADEGLGLPAEALERIFEPFVRLPGEHSASIQGVGLGLHICGQIMRAHGGRVWAESEGPGRGSRFHVFLPTRSAGGEARATSARC